MTVKLAHKFSSWIHFFYMNHKDWDTAGLHTASLREHQSKPQTMNSAEMCQCAFEINPLNPPVFLFSFFYGTHQKSHMFACIVQGTTCGPKELKEKLHLHPEFYSLPRNHSDGMQCKSHFCPLLSPKGY